MQNKRLKNPFVAAILILSGLCAFIINIIISFFSDRTGFDAGSVCIAVCLFVLLATLLDHGDGEDRGKFRAFIFLAVAFFGLYSIANNVVFMVKVKHFELAMLFDVICNFFYIASAILVVIFSCSSYKNEKMVAVGVLIGLCGVAFCFASYIAVKAYVAMILLTMLHVSFFLSFFFLSENPFA